MPALDIDAVVFDVIGTLVDETAGIRAGIGDVAPRLRDVDSALRLWQGHIAGEQERILAGERDYVASDALDREAAGLVARSVGIDEPAAVDTLALAGRRLPAWPDSAAGLARLAALYPLVGLSNASPTALLSLNAHAGLRWHQALSADGARTYKPAQAVYQLAATVSGSPPRRLLMVAAHAWDLRAAQQFGMRTAYVPRPEGVPPEPSDRFDLYPTDLADLADRLSQPG